MAGIQSKRFSFVRQQSYWEQLQARRERSKAMREQAEAASSQLSSVVQTATGDQTIGAAELAAKMAAKRIADAADAERAKARKEAAAKEISIWRNKEPPQSVNAGDTTIDLSGGTVTLSDGTMIDIKTGKPPGNYLKLADGTQIDLKTGHKVINIVT